MVARYIRGYELMRLAKATIKEETADCARVFYSNASQHFDMGNRLIAANQFAIAEILETETNEK